MDGAAELTRDLLPVSEVPLDISARTHNKPVLLTEAASHLAPLRTERRAKTCRWINLTRHGILCSQMKQELYMLASALTT